EASGAPLGQMQSVVGDTLNGNVVLTGNLLFVSSATKSYAFDRVTRALVWSTNFGGTLSWGNQALLISNGNGLQVVSSLSFVTTTANITPKPLTVSGITANNKTYDHGTAATLTVSNLALA